MTPSSARARISAAVKVLLTLAIANAVDGVTGVFFATSARPLTPSQELPSGKRIVTEMPGTPYRSRSRSRRACSARRMAGVAVSPDGSGARMAMDETTGRGLARSEARYRSSRMLGSGSGSVAAERRRHDERGSRGGDRIGHPRSRDERTERDRADAGRDDGGEDQEAPPDPRPTRPSGGHAQRTIPRVRHGYHPPDA